MSTTTLQTRLAELLAYGFDGSQILESDAEKPAVYVKCSQCAACAINGVPCHEKGCPNSTRECRECETRIPACDRLCDSCAEGGF